MIGWQIRLVLQVSERLRRGEDERAIEQALRLRGRRLANIRAGLAAGGLPRAAPTLERLATSHRDMNSHRAGAERVLEALVLELTAPT